MKQIASSILAGLTLLCSNASNAQLTFNPFTPAAGFNAITSGDITAKGGDTHGPVAMGGNLNLNGQTIFTMNTSGTYPTGTLNDYNNYGMVINGRIVYSSGNSTQVNRGSLKLGDATGSTVWYLDQNNTAGNLRVTNGGYNNNPRLELARSQAQGTATTAHGLNFTTIFNNLIDNSLTIADYASNTAYSPYLNRITIPSTNNPQITLVDNKINYISITTSQLTALNSQGSITFTNSPNVNRPIVWNITGTGSYSWTTPNIASINESDGAYILWNFSGLTSLTATGSNNIYGSLLAPNAVFTKTNPNNLNGQVATVSLSIEAGEIHYWPFSALLYRIPAGAALPLKLISFSGIQSNNKAELNWVVDENETGNYFEIERSADGRTFERAAMAFTTSASGQQNYKYADNGLNLVSGSYYRLKLVSKDLSYSYSSIIFIKSAKSVAPEIKLLQNPVSQLVSFNMITPISGKAEVSVYDLSGHKIQSSELNFVSGNNAVQMSLNSQMSSGIYLLEVVQNGTRSVARLVKN